MTGADAATLIGLAESNREPHDDPDPYWDYDEHECANCGGEGFVYGCSWDWQCDTYDEGEGTCLCTRPCDWCSPRKPDPELRAVLAASLRSLATDKNGGGE